MIEVFKNERSAIIYEKRKSASMFSLARDFVYLRHVLFKDNVLISERKNKLLNHSH